MHIYYHDHYVLPLPPDHRFPMSKYSLLRERVATSGIVPPEHLHSASAATDEQLTLVHSEGYVLSVQYGTLTRQQIRKIGFPWSPQMVERSRRSTGATIEACRAALRDGAGLNLAGGTHHAFADSGGGYCVFNDSAVAARVMQTEGRVRQVVVIDCDVHQGDGTASIFQGDNSVFTFSIHGAKNYPFHKPASDLDIALPDDTSDDMYLTLLEEGLCVALEESRAELAIYLAGADPFEGDTLGRLALTKAGLHQRDALVLGMCQAAGLPVAISMAGGYAKHVEDTVDIHFATVSLAAEMFPT